jgi:hypothetical protein
VADGSAGQVLGGKVASGRQGGLRECGRLNVPINILFSSGRWIDKTVASSHLMYTLRATVEFRDLLESGSLALINLGRCEEVRISFCETSDQSRGFACCSCQVSCKSCSSFIALSLASSSAWSATASVTAEI